MIASLALLPREGEHDLLGDALVQALAELDGLDDQRRQAVQKLDAAREAVLIGHRDDVACRAACIRSRSEQEPEFDAEQQAQLLVRKAENELEALRAAFAGAESDIAALVGLERDAIRTRVEQRAEAARRNAISALETVSRESKRRALLSDLAGWLDAPSTQSGSLRAFSPQPIAIHIPRDASLERLFTVIGERLENPDAPLPANRMPRRVGQAQEHTPPQRQLRPRVSHQGVV
jgi:hypothetical protein